MATIAKLRRMPPVGFGGFLKRSKPFHLIVE
jgi:hypothetical protein